MAQRIKKYEAHFQAVEAYIKRHYAPKKSAAESILGGILRGGSPDIFGARGATHGLPSSGLALKGILDAVMSRADKTFAERLLYLMKRSGKTPADIYTKAGITKQHFSKIRNNPGYKPTKETALAFAVALRLSLPETKDLLGRAGYALSKSSKSDLIVEYFIEEGIYDVDEINYNLDIRGLGTLTNRRNGME